LVLKHPPNLLACFGFAQLYEEELLHLIPIITKNIPISSGAPRISTWSFNSGRAYAVNRPAVFVSMWCCQVCVLPSVRSQARQDNAVALSRIAPSTPLPRRCSSGYCFRKTGACALRSEVGGATGAPMCHRRHLMNHRRTLPGALVGGETTTSLNAGSRAHRRLQEEIGTRRHYDYFDCLVPC
jgi:hypothetical protein